MKIVRIESNSKLFARSPVPVDVAALEYRAPATISESLFVTERATERTINSAKGDPTPVNISVHSKRRTGVVVVERDEHSGVEPIGLAALWAARVVAQLMEVCREVIGEGIALRMALRNEPRVFCSKMRWLVARKNKYTIRLNGRRLAMDCTDENADSFSPC
jgi:hypothetical protein